MRWWLAVMALTSACYPLRGEPTLAEARARLLKGNYAEARALYVELIKSPQQAEAAAIGLSQTAESEGNDDEAQRVIAAALTSAPSAALHARLAELSYQRGDWAGADASLAAALKLDPDNFSARWVRGRLYRDRGAYEQADTEFRWFVRTYVARNRAGQDIRDPEQLLIVGLAGTENARWHQLADQYRFILDEIYGEALKADANFWPAEAQAGWLLLEKHNRPEALAAFDKALTINPRAVDALVGKGRLALQQFERGEAETLGRRAVEVNGKHLNALLLLADVALSCGDDLAARRWLDRAHTVNPRDEGVAGRRAALAKIWPDVGPSLADLEKDAKHWNPKPGRFYYEMGSRLDDRRHYDAARDAYRLALECFPQLHAAKAELGLLALRMGEEETAKGLLNDAFRADPYHVRVSNALKVLKHLDAYTTVRTEHFIIRFDPRTDPILGRLLPEYLERDYEQLAKQFDHRPAGPFVVELFNNHEFFSGRIIAGPDLHTVGATTGRVFALAGPRAAGIRQPYNWARVIRHELTHIFNLDQTRFLVPHWLTEGLAVGNEGFNRPRDWLRVLASRTARNELFAIEQLNQGFTRPRTPEDWSLAYCQAHLLVEHLVSRHGAAVIPRLLRAFRDGRDTPSALAAATGTPFATLEANYRKHVRELVAQAGAEPDEKPMTLAQLEAARAKAPGDATLSVRLAEQYLRRKRVTEAGELVDAALAKEPTHSRAMGVRAQILLEAGQIEQAQEVLDKAAGAAAPYPKTLLALGRLYHQSGRYSESLAVFERGQKLAPADPSWLDEIARTAQKSGEAAKAIVARAAWLRSEADDLDARRDFAAYCIELEKFSEAERAAREGIEIDPADAACQDALMAALRKQGKSAEADRWQKLFARDK